MSRKITGYNVISINRISSRFSKSYFNYNHHKTSATYRINVYIILSVQKLLIYGVKKITELLRKA